MYSTEYNLWTFTWFVHFELPFRLKGTENIHTEGFSKIPSNIYSILFAVYWKRTLRDYCLIIQYKHQICSTLSEYKGMGRFWILNFTQSYQNHLLTIKYCSVKDCNSTSSCENVILQVIKEQWIAIVKWKTNSPRRICSRHFEKQCYSSQY